jgi:hypothetical protein
MPTSLGIEKIYDPKSELKGDESREKKTTEGDIISGN